MEDKTETTSIEEMTEDADSPKKKPSQKRKAEEMEVEEKKVDRPVFPPAKKDKLVKIETRTIFIPVNRMTPLKESWKKIYTPIVEHLKLNIRFNMKTKSVEMRTAPETEDPNSLQKACDFIQAFVYGFDANDCLALLRLDELYLETFDIKDVKGSLTGDHLSRAIGRVAGRGGKTRYTIENATRTRIILANSRVHILGSYQNIQIARRAICNLILGSPPSKVFGNLRAFADRARNRF